MYMYCSCRYYFISFIINRIKGGKGMGIFSIIIGYNELLRLVHYNQQGVGYNETEKPKRFTKFHYI